MFDWIILDGRSVVDWTDTWPSPLYFVALQLQLQLQPGEQNKNENNFSIIRQFPWDYISECLIMLWSTNKNQSDCVGTADRFIMPSPWRKITNKINFSRRSQKSKKEDFSSDKKDDDVFQIDEEICSVPVGQDFFDFRTRSSFRALLVKTYSIPLYKR